MPIPQVTQLELSEDKRKELQKLIEDDWSRDSADLQGRNNALRRWYRLWKNGLEPNAFPDSEKSNFSVPFIAWNILAKLSKEIDALLGEESEIMVTPIGDSDVDRVPKVKKWINWRIKNSLKLFKDLYVYLEHKNIYGTAIGWLQWETRKRLIKKMVKKPITAPQIQSDPLTGLPMTKMVEIGSQTVEQEVEVIEHDGPVFRVENIEDYVVPATARDFNCDHFIRRLYVSVDDILDMADEGKLDKAKVDEKITDLRRMAEKDHPQDTAATEQVTAEKAIQTGVPEVPQGRESEIQIHNWIGKFRKDDSERSMDVVAFYQPDLHILLGVCRLVDIYPDGYRPALKSECIKDGDSFWGRGYAEMLESISGEVDTIVRRTSDLLDGAVGPILLYTPASGMNPTATRLEPNMAIACADVNAAKVINIGAGVNVAPFLAALQLYFGFGERLTGLTDAQMGRQFDRPNAPRTFGQQALLQAESNVRLLLDIRLERENLRELIGRIWEMDKRWLPKPYFFRVTEQDGGDVLTDEDMMGEYDFDLGPVTSVSNRAVRMQETMQALALSQPIPQAYVPLLKKVISKLGHPDVAAMIPDPMMTQPKTPEQEHVRILQGEDVDPHPLDNHQVHMAKHSDFMQRVQQEIPVGMGGDGKPMTTSLAVQNPGLLGRIQAHIAEHQQAMQQGALAFMGMPTGNAGGGVGGNQAGPGLMGQIAGMMPKQNPIEEAQSGVASLVNSGGLNAQ